MGGFEILTAETDRTVEFVAEVCSRKLPAIRQSGPAA